jgi:putative ABC transport system substrate-binding protein
MVVTPAIRRLPIVVIVLLLLLAAPLAVEAQQAGTKRIGYLESSSPSPARLQLLEAFRQGLRQRGYLEGKGIILESRFGEGKPDQIQRFAAELVGLKVDILVTSGTPATQAAKQTTRTIPIVMTQLADRWVAGSSRASVALVATSRG